ncbi:MAG: hypothetical protein SFY69_08360 [Planctomycetota bacterium]|nr:hypothetical protein [Planctomycetota bacterium]
MELTAQQKFASGVLVIGLIALGVDKLVLSGGAAPATAHATTDTGGAPAPAASARARAPEAESLAERLRRMAAQMEGEPPPGGVFRCPPEWLPGPSDDAPAPVDAPEVSSTPTGLRLTSVSTGVAVVNGVTLALGESVALPDGSGRATLVAVDAKERRATFSVAGHEVALQVPTGTRGAPR